MQFYYEMATSLKGNWANAKGVLHHVELGPDPFIWKTLGDELVFVKTITDPRQVPVALSVFQTALIEFRDIQNDQRLEMARLGIHLQARGAAWLAGFPVTNSEVILKHTQDLKDLDAAASWSFQNTVALTDWYSGENIDGDSQPPTGLIRDFIGPSIDTGFRLAAFSTPREIVISPEVAWWIAESERCYRTDKKLTFPELYFGGTRKLTGVLDGVPYPIYWLDAMKDEPLANAENAVTGRKSVDMRNVGDHIKAFVERYKALHLPFLNGAEHIFGEKPDWVDAKIQEMISAFERDHREYEQMQRFRANSGV